MRKKFLKLIPMLCVPVMLIGSVGVGNDGGTGDKVRMQVQNGHTSEVNEVAWSPNGSVLASGSSDTKIILWSKNGNLLKELVGHSNEVTSLEWNPNGKVFASGSNDSTVHLWRYNGSIIKVLTGHSSEVNIVAWSPDGKILASGSGDKTIRLWRTNGDLIKELSGHSESIIVISWSPDGSILATGSSDGIMRLWRKDGTLIKEIKSGTVVSWSPDSKILAIGSEDKIIRLWRTNGELIKELSGHSDRISSLSWNPDGGILASSSYNNIILWLPDGRIKKKIAGGCSYRKSLLWRPDGKILAAVIGDEKIKLLSFDGNTNIEISGQRGWFKSIVWSPDGSIFAARAEGNTIRLYTTNGKIIRELIGNARYVNTLLCNPVYRIIAFTSSDGTLRFWRNDGSLINEHKPDMSFSSQSMSGYLAWSPDGTVLASGSDDKTVRLWDENGRLLKIFEGHTDNISSLSWSSNGKILASARGKTIRLWSSDGHLLKILEGHNDSVKTLSWSSDGTILASGSDDKTVRLWDENGHLLKILEGHTDDISSLSWSPNGKILASASVDKSIRLWSKEGNLLKILNVQSSRITISWSPDGKTLAAASKTWELSMLEDKYIRLWGPDGRLLKVLEGHNNGITCLSWSLDGKILASGSSDKTIRLWSSDGCLLKILEVHDLGVRTLSWSHDNKILASAGWVDTTIRFWNPSTGDSIAILAFPSGDWIHYDKNGRFDCSAGAKKYIGFVKDMEYYEPDQFWESFYTPDLMKRFLAGEKFPEVSIDEMILRAPRVAIESPAMGFEPKDDTVTVTVKATPGTNGLGRVFLYHNGRAVDENTRGIQVDDATGLKKFTLTLIEGEENRIRAAAFDSDNRVEGRSGEIVLSVKEGAIERPDLYLLAVGVSSYKEKSLRLTSPRDDAAALAGAFQKVAAGLYGNCHITVLSDDKARRADVLVALDNIAAKARAMDTVVIFFAGHGLTESNIYYFLPHDADMASLERTCIPMELVNGFLKKLAARKVALFLDTCQSGGAAQDLAKLAMSRSVSEKRIIAGLAKNRGIAVFSAAGGTQAAWEVGALGHGIFTHCMLEALEKGGDRVRTDKKLITVSRLISVVNEKTREAALKYLKVEQEPIQFTFGDDFALGR